VVSKCVETHPRWEAVGHPVAVKDEIAGSVSEPITETTGRTVMQGCQGVADWEAGAG